MATEVIFLRVTPDIKELLAETVKGMNASRIPGEPEHTITSVVLGCIGQTLAPGEGKLTRAMTKASGKQSRKAGKK